MDITSWFQLAVLCLLGAMSPGPSLALVINNTVVKGRMYGIVTSLGHATGIGWWALLTAIGVTELLGDQGSVLLGFKACGACFLGYIGFRTIMADEEKQTGQIEKLKPSSEWLMRGAIEGFLISLLNPKVALFFLVIFSHFVYPDSSQTDIGIMGITAASIDASWYVFVVLMLTTTKFNNILKDRESVARKSSGIILVLISLYLIMIMIKGTL